MNELFDFDKCYISQKILATRAKYYVFNEAGQKIFYIERTANFQMMTEFMVYKDDTKSARLLRIRQDKFLAFFPKYNIYDASDNIIGKIKKKWNPVYPRMLLFDSRDQELAQTAVDPASYILNEAVKRMDVLKIDFMRGRNKLGEFTRQLTIRDKYLLDLSGDQGRLVDRRIAVCTAVLLDAVMGR